MKRERLERMVRGWFVGDFEPTAHRTPAVEVAVKTYLAGDTEPLHHHRLATEVTVVIAGAVEMCGTRFASGDIVVLRPNEATDFRAIEDSITVVVKEPGARDDKYAGERRDA